MDTLEQINKEYELRMELIDTRLKYIRLERSLQQILDRQKRIKDLVRQMIIVVVILIGIALGGYSLFCTEEFKEEEWETKIYFVQYKDTLWSIGEEVTDNKIDIRVWVDEVIELNDLETDRIYPRDIIKIYVPKEVEDNE